MGQRSERAREDGEEVDEVVSVAHPVDDVGGPLLGWVLVDAQLGQGVGAPVAKPAVDLTRLQRQLRARVSSVQLVT